MAELNVESVISDERWEFLGPLLPNLNPRAMLAAIVHAVTTDTAWEDLPDEFGVTPRAARRRFDAWTDTDLWRQLAVAATGTRHAQWVGMVTHAAIDRAGNRACGWPDPYPPAIPDEVLDGAEPTPPAKTYYQPSAKEYAEAHDALNRHNNTP